LNTLDIHCLREMLICISEKIIENEDYLTQIDLQTGDGDHGTSMALGFGAVHNMLIQRTDFSAARVLFKETGMTLIDSMGGTSGVIFGTLFISGAVELPDTPELTLTQFTEMLERSLSAIMQRGRAVPGDKTMVDALMPAIKGLHHGINSGMSIPDTFAYAAAQAKNGMESTKTMQAKAGRAKAYRERSVGHEDAGAVSVYIMFQAISDYFNK